MKNLIRILFIFFIIFFSCQEKKGPIVIKKINIYDKIDTVQNHKGGILKVKSDYFIIENFHSKKQDSSAILQFVKRYNRNKEFDSYVMVFYKSSSITNLKEIINGPGEITYQSDENDLLYNIVWGYNKRIRISSIKNGETFHEIYRDSL